MKKRQRKKKMNERQEEKDENQTEVPSTSLLMQIFAVTVVEIPA